jgi:hypothetical protein
LSHRSAGTGTWKDGDGDSGETTDTQEHAQPARRGRRSARAVAGCSYDVLSVEEDAISDELLLGFGLFHLYLIDGNAKELMFELRIV